MLKCPAVFILFGFILWLFFGLERRKTVLEIFGCTVTDLRSTNIYKNTTMPHLAIASRLLAITLINSCESYENIYNYKQKAKSIIIYMYVIRGRLNLNHANFWNFVIYLPFKTLFSAFYNQLKYFLKCFYTFFSS